MNRKKINKNNVPRGRFLAVAALLTVAATGGCSLFGLDEAGAEDKAEQQADRQQVDKQQVDNQIWHMRDMYVRLEAQDKLKGAPPPPNQQPVTIAQSQLYNALSQVTIKTNEKIGYVPLFTEFELGILSQNISTGLAQARADEDVTFAVIGWHKGGGSMFTVSTQQLTSGRVFYQNGQVNLIIGVAHRDVSEGENYATAGAAAGDRRTDPFVPGMRGMTQPHKWELAAAPNSGVYSAPGGKRSDWLVFSAQAFAAAPPPVPGQRPAAPSAAEQAKYDQLNKQVQQMQQELQNMRQNQGAAPAAAYPAQPPGYPAQSAYPAYPAQPAYPGYQAPANPGYPAPAQAPGQSPSGGQSIQDRLMVLDDLKNKGLISDAEYQQKRNQILSGN
jgi:hypothetical protein